jgi:hypothetical protein
MSRPAGFTRWSLAPHHIAGLTPPDAVIPIEPPTNYAPGTAEIFRARSKVAMKAIPEWELLAYFLRAPELVFAQQDRTWFRERWARLVKLRAEARLAAIDGSRKRYERLVHATRFRWRVLVQRSIGLRHMGGKVTHWR